MHSKSILFGAVVALFFCSQLEGTRNGTTSANREKVLSRKRRYLLFPPGANFIVTVSGGKGAMFETPRGYNLVAELDMYHPLPDYMYHATSLRLGEVAMYPDELTTTSMPVPAVTHQQHELSEQELNEYLKDHPEAWIPPSWAKDRADYTAPKIPTSIPLNGMKYLQKRPQYAKTPVTYQSWKRKLWESTGNDRLYYSELPPKRARSLLDFGTEDRQSSFWMEANQLNISHHLGWEHFHHYRDRRSLFHHLETTIPNFFGFHMRECLLRSICEARNLLPPKGRSMTVDILRVIFTYPLKADLSDEYSKMLRAEKPNCRELFSDRCPMSILQLILFGKFEL
ncbi:uncharacterized protein LOC126558579 [Anopheles maculipalpis]|uniref:uncharacterized protein LOC126558579 n=1 Tax=Anopheles maculipalpis TaxID=1496333 RepID=UPI0021594228|nr:uncharacterized protein LOC126558579 [Anopheles maculipalpis]